MSEALANQIAAGEVIQRPASVVKELVENSVDAGASKIVVNIKDAGRTLVQVIDNGCGMSEKDALMSFERHATSKIYTADDLFCIYTKGFRGEALASIASVAEVELKTRQEGDMMATDIIMSGGQLVSQQPCSAPVGTNFAVKSLFFNVPARRKFLKGNTTEFQHIVTEFLRVALTHPMIEFQLYHNEQMVYTLPKVSLKQRIVTIFGKSLNSDLIPVEIDTSIVKITGFTGKPTASKKRNDKQYFFVNNRYMKNPYFNKAVVLAYDKLILPDTAPPYFLYFEVDPHSIDINVHPTKTEINFENGPDIFRLLQAGIRETLNKCDVAPSIDFDNTLGNEIPYFSKNDPAPGMPEIQFDPFYNPFESTEKRRPASVPSAKNSYQGYQGHADSRSQHNLSNWESLYENIEERQSTAEPTQLSIASESGGDSKIIQVKNKYIVSPVKSGLMIIDQYRAHYRILHTKYLGIVDNNADGVQTLLYPQPMPMDVQSQAMCFDIRDELQSVGYKLEFSSDKEPMLLGIPPFLDQGKAMEVLVEIIDSYNDEHGNISSSIKDILAKTLARREAIQAGRQLNVEEMRQIIDSLFATPEPNYSPDGRPAVVIMSMDEIEKRFS